MKIALAQVQPQRGNINDNIRLHTKWINEAIKKNCDLIVFPELSITGYEPKLAKNLATDATDVRFSVFQELSNTNTITIGIGIPLNTKSGILIGLMFFIPHQPPVIYAKQHLHSDELPYFTHGDKQIILPVKTNNIAPAICYESLHPIHCTKAKQLGANIYLVSVAKPQNGIIKAYTHYPKIAKQHNIHVLMVNSIGYCDNFYATGQSAIWDTTGKLASQLDETTEGLLTYTL